MEIVEGSSLLDYINSYIDKKTQIPE